MHPLFDLWSLGVWIYKFIQLCKLHINDNKDNVIKSVHPDFRC